MCARGREPEKPIPARRRHSISISRGLSSSSDTYFRSSFSDARIPSGDIQSARSRNGSHPPPKPLSDCKASWRDGAESVSSGYLPYQLSRVISTGCPCLRWAGRRGCRRVPPKDWTPWRPFSRHPAPPYASHPGAPGPSPPYPPLRLQSSSGHR